MKPLRRELLNGVLVLVVASLLSVAFSAFQVSFNPQLWVLILMALAIAVSGYILFEFTLGVIASAEDRVKEWLKRVGTPARIELNREGEPAGLVAVGDALKIIKPGSDYTVMFYIGASGDDLSFVKDTAAVREKYYGQILELLKVGTIREYKRLMCFDYDVLANDPELKSGILRVGEGPGTISRVVGEHCRRIMETRGCSLYVAPAILRFSVVLYGGDKVAITVDTAADQHTGDRRAVGVLSFSDPPNAEIIDQFRQIERATERRMVAVHKIRFPEDATPIAERAAL